MLNQVCLCGVVIKQFVEDEEDFILLEVKRPFKSIDKTFKSDVIKIRIWKGCKERTNYSFNNGKLITVAGMLKCGDGINYFVEAYDVSSL